MKATMPASMSRSVRRTFWFNRPNSAATWQTSVVAPHPPLAERNPRAFPLLLVLPSRLRLRSTERRSRALRSGSLSGGYRYSLIPARSDDKMASESAVVFRAMIMGSPAALRIEVTKPSSGSFQPLMSTSTTSGRMRSSRSRKFVTSPTSWCSTMMRNGKSDNAVCVWSHNSRFSIASPIVSGYMIFLRGRGSLAGPPLRRGCGGRKARIHLLDGRGRHDHKLGHGWRRRRLALLLLLDQLFQRHGLVRGLYRNRPGLVHPRLRQGNAAVGLHERLLHGERGQGLIGGERTHDFGRHDHQQLRVVALLGTGLE